MIPNHTLREQGLEISAIDLVCMATSSSQGPPKDTREMIALIHRARTLKYLSFRSSPPLSPPRLAAREEAIP